MMRGKIKGTICIILLLLYYVILLCKIVCPGTCHNNIIIVNSELDSVICGVLSKAEWWVYHSGLLIITQMGMVVVTADY